MGSFRVMCFIFLFVPYAVGKDKVTPHPTEEKQGCPKVCKCPVKLTCPLGRPKAFDKCECGCSVCVQTLDLACDGFRPCDATQNLTCVYSTGPENKQGVCKVIRKHRSCFNNGSEVLHGQTFQDGCTGRCKCDDGMISCVSLCPPVGSAPIPGCLDMRYESVPGECCKQWKCVKYESTDPNHSQGDPLHPTSKENTSLTANTRRVKIPSRRNPDGVIRKHRSCFNNGSEVLHGQTFQDGCTGRCKCDDGMISCVSLCPPVGSAPIPGCLDMRYESVPGECCKQWKCVKYESTDPNLSQGDPLHPTSKKNTSLTANTRGDKIPSRRNPDGVIRKHRSCFNNGSEVLHGQTFQDGCTGRCKCDDGMISCVSLCPPVGSAPIPGCLDMRYESVPGECCKQWKCVKYESTDPNHSHGDSLHPTSKENTSLTANTRRVKIPSRRNPDGVIRKYRSCFNNGSEVLHGQTFQDGCTGRCKCDDGMISCVSLCPPVGSAPIPGCLDMRYESVPGECCKQWKCVKNESTDPNHSQGDPLHPNNKENTSLTADTQGVKDGVIGKQRSCLIDGTEYLHGEKFQFGCVGRCECRDGAIGCLSLCPPSQPAPIPGCKKMQLESVPGQCCKEWKCKEYDSVDQSQGLPLSPTSNKNDSHGVKGQGVKRRTREISDIEDDDSLNSESTCTKEATEWTTCSRPCGFGRSVRLNYDQETCRPQAERRLCMIRPCMGEYTAANYTILKSSKVCNRLVRWSEPLHLYHRGCQSVRSVQPRFCGQCTDGRICAPSASETLSLVFHCPHNNRRVTRQIMWLVKCSCGKKGGKKRGERKKGEENNREKEMDGNKGTEIEELATNDIEVGG
ncbi:kielin/chordin-like protein isoform X2 [Pelobates fuscus]|uniref:kielin/chordin-like protein isoform X2 n=1 Tax=Pelobates fuscus TaxID=191477 RepID=UPI002FE4AC70